MNKIISIILFIPSVLYGLFIEIRDIFYSTGLLATNRLSVPVISVGNITLGGTGKTPFIIWLAEFLKMEGHKVGILTRGYGRKNKSENVILSTDNKVSDYNVTGDEPLLIKNHIDPDIPIIIGPKRVKTGLLLEKKFQTDVVLLDDGFQHISLKRDLDVVIIDALNPFGNFNMFPAGILRERINNLKRADVFLITKVDLVPADERNKIVDFIRMKVAGAVIIEGVFEAQKFVGLDMKREYPIEYVSKKRCIALSGIGNPNGFLMTLRNIGVFPLEHIVFPDHYSFQKKDINKINSDLIITTEKDAIRLMGLGLEDRVLFLPVKLKITSGEETLKEIIRKVLKNPPISPFEKGGLKGDLM